MNNKQKDKIVLKALDELFVKDLTDLCIKNRFAEAEKVAQMRMKLMLKC